MAVNVNFFLSCGAIGRWNCEFATVVEEPFAPCRRERAVIGTTGIVGRALGRVVRRAESSERSFVSLVNAFLDLNVYKNPP